MKVVITKKQYKEAAYKFLKTFLGELRYEKNEASISVYGKNDSIEDIHNPPMTIWTGTQGNPGCKKDLTLSYDFSHQLDQFFPLTRKKIFSDVLVKYVYDKTGIKCDCVDYSHNFDLSGENSNQYRFNVKKRKKINENFLTEANLKNLLVNKLGIDLTGKVEMITNTYDIPKIFLGFIGPRTLNDWLNQYGPMYLFTIDYRHILYQYQSNAWTEGHSGLLISRSGNTYSDAEFLELLGIPPMGITIQDIIDTFVKEE
jgi:hypothetical protein